MPAHYICDGGCGATTADPNEWKEHGYAVKTRYCPKCECGILAYNKAIDELHDELQGQWKDGLAKVRGDYFKDHPDGSLPDVEGN